MKVQPRFEKCPKLSLVGKKLLMSIIENRTQELWKSFMPKRGQITNRVGEEYYSVEVYSGLDYFKAFDPIKKFEKWAAVKVNDYNSVPETMEQLIIPEGDYAVFLYKGESSNVTSFYQYIFTEWLPNSEYELDDRPHFAVMAEKYKNNDPSSEEEIWIPIRE